MVYLAFPSSIWLLLQTVSPSFNKYFLTLSLPSQAECLLRHLRNRKPASMVSRDILILSTIILEVLILKNVNMWVAKLHQRQPDSSENNFLFSFPVNIYSTWAAVFLTWIKQDPFTHIVPQKHLGISCKMLKLTKKNKNTKIKYPDRGMVWRLYKHKGRGFSMSPQLRLFILHILNFTHWIIWK